ncbi:MULTISPECIES: GrpB family protein [Mesobacillus]|uniref:GrpB family protein n=2 Tax=Mesobacillus TaxID=2675231 RepID=A0A0D6Z895_9BACI|nr:MULTISPECIES: GrpB family protein [Mesobacillus]KIY21590.1 hypothetical protein UB32_12840 [Mesobacillus subterraneus]MDQ0413767.1 GrpB-like predicted nucleotidyltransferase (UPF0157 family) [Mesobacillus stamsii]
MTKRRVEVVAYRTEWPALFEQEKQLIGEIFNWNGAEIYHIGSTSVPGLSAKPIIDIMLAANSLELVEEATPALEAAGYAAMGENGIQERRYFQKVDENGIRKVHLHAFEKGSDQIYRHLVFRDYLRFHSKEAGEYARVKEEAARKHKNDIESYMETKAPTIMELEEKAKRWRPF